MQSVGVDRRDRVVARVIGPTTQGAPMALVEDTLAEPG